MRGREEATTHYCLDTEVSRGRGRGPRVITKDGRLVTKEGSLRKKGLIFAHSREGMAVGV